MKMLLACAIAAATLMGQGMQPPKTNLKVGDTAPDFTLNATTGGKVTLSDFRGKNVVVLAFFPAAFTGGWTKEAQQYQAGIEKFESADTKVFMISTDNTPSQKEFAAKNNVSFPLLSDFANRKVAAAYGVLIEQAGVANRATFVVDKEGKIIYIQEGSSAIDPTGASDACSRAAHKQ
jgi:mycoredoxin-dependent peroxiredoxin